MEFTSERKRMSVIVRRLSDNRCDHVLHSPVREAVSCCTFGYVTVCCSGAPLMSWCVCECVRPCRCTPQSNVVHEGCRRRRAAAAGAWTLDLTDHSTGGTTAVGYKPHVAHERDCAGPGPGRGAVARARCPSGRECAGPDCGAVADRWRSLPSRACERWCWRTGRCRQRSTALGRCSSTSPTVP